MRKPDPEMVERIRHIVEHHLERIKKARAARAMQHRQRYQALRKLGLCVRCKNDALPGMALCMNCMLFANQYRSGAATAPRSPYKDGKRSDYVRTHR